MPAELWDPDRYARFQQERARPFQELLARVGAAAPGRVVDLGCGTGELTRTLLQRWPQAEVEGIDSSEQMLTRARSHAVPGRLHFSRGDLRDWRPEHPVDVLVANASLQEVPGHLDLLHRLTASIAPGGWLAIQVPGNFSAPSHRLLAQLRTSPRWRAKVGAGAHRDRDAAEPHDYLRRLSGLGLRTEVWETTYLHVLPGEDAVLDWVRGTALRPVLQRLDPADTARFEAEYASALREAYPRQPYGTVFPFRRIFAVGQLRTA